MLISDKDTGRLVFGPIGWWLSVLVLVAVLAFGAGVVLGLEWRKSDFEKTLKHIQKVLQEEEDANAVLRSPL